MMGEPIPMFGGHEFRKKDCKFFIKDKEYAWWCCHGKRSTTKLARCRNCQFYEEKGDSP